MNQSQSLHFVDFYSTHDESLSTMSPLLKSDGPYVRVPETIRTQDDCVKRGYCGGSPPVPEFPFPRESSEVVT